MANSNLRKKEKCLRAKTKLHKIMEHTSEIISDESFFLSERDLDYHDGCGLHFVFNK